MSDGIPSNVNLKEHSFKYIGAEANTGLITGIQKPKSIDTMAHIAVKFSTGNDRALLVDAHFNSSWIDNTSMPSCLYDIETSRNYEWIDFARLSKKFKVELKNMWLTWIEADFGEIEVEKCRELRLEDISLKFPKYVAKLLGVEKSINGISHQVKPVLDPENFIWASTVRYEKNRFSDVKLRFVPTTEIHF